MALYGNDAASHRVRLSQYRAGLLESGIDLQVHSILDNSYLRSRSIGDLPSLLTLARNTLKRIKLVADSKRFDVALIHCELFPFLPWWFERFCLRIPYIYDFDDAWYLRYRMGTLKFARGLLGNKSDKVIASASAVTAGNAFLADYACNLNPNVCLLPSVVDTQRFRKVRLARNTVFTVGWIGSKTTAKFLDSIVGPLAKLGAETRIRFVVIGANAPQIENVEVLEIPWSELTEVGSINRLDLGLMPLFDDEWSHGKCAFKLVQYMACEVPVIASRIGANLDLVTPDCGFLVRNEDEWLDALRWMRDHPDERRVMGEAARTRIENNYSLERNLVSLANIIRQVANVDKI